METDILVGTVDGMELHYQTVGRDAAAAAAANSSSDKEFTGTPDDPFQNSPVVDKSQGQYFSYKKMYCMKTIQDL